LRNSARNKDYFKSKFNRRDLNKYQENKNVRNKSILIKFTKKKWLLYYYNFIQNIYLNVLFGLEVGINVQNPKIPP